ncbi:hypothetical protein C922_05502 [Plasmodium inui San Antonio 1]|uniref:Uncharacterized protein n=1 Tax=Plasmodium inui San Antonio 1 TaxID=1237626 RepID=W7AFQ4_9APIC|nr:hypothetical protein C922_05502 [Plasmodium inui San Antonio 1]EUD64121.1 hypothetical protein C922_05502 [Plasmodium inui San Antonio 1]
MPQDVEQRLTEELDKLLETTEQNQTGQDTVTPGTSLQGIIQGIAGVGALGGFIPFAWYIWRRIFRTPRAPQPQRYGISYTGSMQEGSSGARPNHDEEIVKPGPGSNKRTKGRPPTTTELSKTLHA